MKKLSLWISVIIIALSANACKNNKHDSVSKADSLNKVKDTTKSLSIAVDRVDAEFTVKAASGGMAEVELGKLAQQKGVSKQVKNFGAMMVTDHSKINDFIRALAVTKNISIPKAPGARDHKAIGKLAGKSGKAFDKAYINSMIDDHKADIKLFETAAKKCIDPDVKSFAVKNLPILQEHLDAISAIKDSME
ncbi:DUF4142 domain-containing protein [Mucilaginibacter sp.]|uniref:DUF4142 domain-containing protein n=1 Tax=Mucilaginibacter sp. TaxID=1882438 RepID=UPI0025E234FA|nr:DUF4142 domain-containing protein [Mucilaginibacter sp.]